jgi:hypothetical protein
LWHESSNLSLGAFSYPLDRIVFALKSASQRVVLAIVVTQR